MGPRAGLVVLKYRKKPFFPLGLEPCTIQPVDQMLYYLRSKNLILQHKGLFLALLPTVEELSLHQAQFGPVQKI